MTVEEARAPAWTLVLMAVSPSDNAKSVAIATLSGFSSAQKAETAGRAWQDSHVGGVAYGVRLVYSVLVVS